MSDAPEPERDPSAAPYLRLPMPLVAGVLLVFLAALLALGLYANRNLRPQGIVVPTPLEGPTPSATPQAMAAGAAATALTTEARTPLVLVVATPTKALATLAPTLTSGPSPASESPTPLPTVEPALAAEVGKAYENFWRVTSQALLELDETHLPEVMDGDYLATVTKRISELRAEGQAIKTHVILNYEVIQATAQSASVVDDFEDDSVYVKMGTEETLTEPAGDQMRVLYRMRLSSGVWKVFDSVRS